VDVGTGSGVLAVCAARYLPSARVTAVDISPAALEVARSNAERHGVADRIELVESDLLAGIAPERRFDFVVSNPPYVSTAELAALPPDVRKFEPHAALVAGPIGTEVIARLTDQAAVRLAPGGWLISEISPMILEPVQRLLAADRRWSPGPVVKDLAGLPRVVQAQRR
jgi:release factor glutamine methyltransferase